MAFSRRPLYLVVMCVTVFTVSKHWILSQDNVKHSAQTGKITTALQSNISHQVVEIKSDSSCNIRKGVDLAIDIEHAEESNKKQQIWISMGLCFSKNTELHGKKHYPYTEVTPLAILLWHHFVPYVRIILYIVYDVYEPEDRRKMYETNLLKITNNTVKVRWVTDDGMSCVTKSQLVRMWAFQESVIDSRDIVVTVDVNLFVVTSKILDPIVYEHPGKKVWVFQWNNTGFAKPNIDETFNQNLIAAESNGPYIKLHFAMFHDPHFPCTITNLITIILIEYSCDKL